MNRVYIVLSITKTKRNNKKYMNKIQISLIVLVALITLILGSYFFIFQKEEKEPVEEQKQEEKNNDETILPNNNMTAIIQTSLGEIKIKLLSSDAPKTVENFVKLSESGFYDGVKFHRVIKGFMIQAGDPLSKEESMKDRWGTGGPDYAFEDEIHSNNKNVVGSIAMANAGPNTNGSQFFINTNDNNFLDTKHTVFGNVIEGIDIVNNIEEVATEGPDRPIENVVIETIKITKD